MQTIPSHHFHFFSSRNVKTFKNLRPETVIGTNHSPLSWPSMRVYMLLSPNTFRKYQDAELTLHTAESPTVNTQDTETERSETHTQQIQTSKRCLSDVKTLFWIHFTQSHDTVSGCLCCNSGECCVHCHVKCGGVFSVGYYQEASSDSRSIPRCNIGLNLRVRGNGTLAARRQQDKNH